MPTILGGQPPGKIGQRQHAVGNYDIEGPPVPIPNTVVKLNRAENTWWVAAREDRSTPTQKPDFYCPADLLNSAAMLIIYS